MEPQLLSRGRTRPSDAPTATRNRPWDLLLVATVGYLLVGATRVHSLIPIAEAVRPGLLFAILGAFALFVTKHSAENLRWIRHPLALCLGGMVAWATIGAPLSIYPGNAVRYLVGNLYKTVVLFLLIAVSVRTLPDLRRLLVFYGGGAAIFALFAAVPGSFRMVGGGGYDANDTAMLVVSAVPILIYLATSSSRASARLLWLVGAALCTIALVRSGSRGGFLAFGSVVLYQILFFRSIRLGWRLAGTGIVVALLFFVAASQPGFWLQMSTLLDLNNDYNTTEFTGRRQIWNRGIGYTMDHPVFGVGINNFSVAEGMHPTVTALLAQGIGVKFSAPHSIWVQTAAELGMPGFLAFAGAFLVCVAGIWRLRSRARVRGDPTTLASAAMGEAIGGAILVVAVAGTFLSQAYGAMTWAMFGLAMALFKVTAMGGPASAQVPVAAPAVPRIRPSVRFRTNAWEHAP